MSVEAPPQKTTKVPRITQLKRREHLLERLEAARSAKKRELAEHIAAILNGATIVKGL